jgi:predicted dehydrogenase
MSCEKRIAVIGLDTNHAVELPRLINGEQANEGLHVTRCLRFETPFQNKEGLDARSRQLLEMGVTVTEDFNEAVADCDCLMLELNDARMHREYFERCAVLGRPIFLDKPFADSLANAKAIDLAAQRYSVPYFTASPLRFDWNLVQALAQNPLVVDSATVWGPVGRAPSGSSIIWYGCHAIEILQRIMGIGAQSVQVSRDRRGYVGHVCYENGRRGIVELTDDGGRYGGVLREWLGTERLFQSGQIPYYRMLVHALAEFFVKGVQPVSHEDSFEVMALLEAFDRSAQNGQCELIQK